MRASLQGIEEPGVPADAIDWLVHGTTAGTNAVLERKGARAGLITTRGFRDVLELGRRTRPNAYGLSGNFKPLIERRLRLEATERMDAQGRVVTPLSESDVRAAVQQLIDEGAESLVIHFLHSYVNDEHEAAAVRIAREMWPNEHVIAGHEIVREMRQILERERPWIELSHRESYALYQPWMRNVKPLGMSFSILKYRDIDVETRAELREAWNRPLLWPAYALAAAAIGLVIPGIVTFFRERQ